MKKIYTAFSIDFLHEGHIKLLKKASEYGEVIVGLLTDKAIVSYKRIILLWYFLITFIADFTSFISDSPVESIIGL